VGGSSVLCRNIAVLVPDSCGLNLICGVGVLQMHLVAFPYIFIEESEEDGEYRRCHRSHDRK